MKTKEQIAKYNKEYFARPEVKDNSVFLSKAIEYLNNV